MAGKPICDHRGTIHRALYVRVRHGEKRSWEPVGYECLACGDLIRS